MILNESLKFETAADATVKRAFIGGKPEAKVRIESGTKLYKWTSHGLLTAKGISPWWSFVESRALPCGNRTAGFRAMEERAKRLGQPPRDFARVRFAVTRQWNEMSRLLLIHLTADVYGFVGKTFGQLEDQNVDNVFLIGGDYQLWIPGLTTAHVHEIPAQA